MALTRRKFDPETNYYAILDVPYTASHRDITRAYRELMRYAHPDRASSDLERTKAEERAKMLNEAYSVLGKPDVRREYDQAFKTAALNDALFSRYTGNQPGHHARHMHRPARPPTSPRTARAQKRAHRSALFQIMLVTVIFVLIIALGVVVLSLISQGISALF